jgi:hypothetical protein
MTLAAWARATGISDTTIARRLDVYGWTLERALSTPVGTSQPDLKIAA